MPDEPSGVFAVVALIGLYVFLLLGAALAVTYGVLWLLS